MVFNVRESTRLIKEDFPHEVDIVEHLWIPMSDGVRLSAKLWIPKCAATKPVPAVLEYLPYRKNEFTALRDSIRHPYFAGHGYVSIRVDMRGCGDSEGIMYDEYAKQEQDDALEVLDWIAEQDWSTGSVGMIGKSWGGFNGLQVAARQHPALKAIITLCSTDDRYADDVHYKGGVMLASDMLWWASTMLVYNGRPADPQNVGDAWREKWLDRLEKTPPFIEAWMSHQRRDAYWKHGSVCENYGDIKIPVYAVGGWADGYTNAIFRMVQNLKGPKKGLIGPWAHEYPEVAVPGPQIGFLQECLRWWDQWLKEEETGIMDEPVFRMWLQDAVPPKTDYDVRPGEWVLENSWPTENAKEQTMYLGDLQLIDKPDGGKESLMTHQQHGLYAGVYCPFGQEGDMPSDQAIENGLSNTFTGPVLEEELAILGFPKMQVKLLSDSRRANLAVRLSDLSPFGTSKLISWGQLNLTHRNSHEFPEDVPTGEEFIVTVELDAIGYKVPKGHRLQLSVSPVYWPHAWPAAEEADLQIIKDQDTKLLIPAYTNKTKPEDIAAFERPETAAVMDREIIREAGRVREIRHNTVTNEWVLEDFSDEGCRRLPANGLEYGSTNKNVYRITEGDPLSASVVCDWTLTVGREDWQTRLESTSTMTSDASKFYITSGLKAFEGDKMVYDTCRKFEVERDFN
ncbi:CocE/NonD family hydrolase [Planococcus sp. CPCC 101016]|uniref:CocE/NonD family hydrolase n=1 Tax=Planococcus sp. CPCC 101016 TaxID=2599617 RepID=UPI0011B5F197|nr:CocE/NonD family hydrolase [Planococcus sp. CPCC 101016]TWT06424.1 CocE/NonD family hydrolase [Planococcus sp. CPCC 101016]